MRIRELIEMLEQIPDKEKQIGVIYDKGDEKLCGKIKNLGWVNIIDKAEGEFVLIVENKS